MRPIATDITRSVICVYLCVSHTDVPCKMAEPIEMPFGELFSHRISRRSDLRFKIIATLIFHRIGLKLSVFKPLTIFREFYP